MRDRKKGEVLREGRRDGRKDNKKLGTEGKLRTVGGSKRRKIKKIKEGRKKRGERKVRIIREENEGRIFNGN